MVQRIYTHSDTIYALPYLVPYRSTKMAASWLLLDDVWSTQAKRKAEEERWREEKQREEERKEEDNNCKPEIHCDFHKHLSGHGSLCHPKKRKGVFQL